MKINTTGLLALLFLSFFFKACTEGAGVDDELGGATSDTAFFTKNVLVMEFVSFDCVYCPKVSDQIRAVSEKYPGRVDVVSVHGRLTDPDPMEFSAYKPFQNYFYGVTGYPGVIVDQRDDLVKVGNFDETESGFAERIKAKVPVGIALKSKLKGSNTVQVDVQVANKGTRSADYRLAVVVLENNISYRQSDLVDGTIKWIENYQHQHVLRTFLNQNFFGDEIGIIEKDATFSKSFEYDIPAAYKKENLLFVAYVIEAKGFAHRVTVNSRTAGLGESVSLK